MADCDCYGSLFSHDPGCATEVDRLAGAGYRGAAESVERQRHERYGQHALAMAAREREAKQALTHEQVQDLRLRMKTAKAELLGLCRGRARLEGKAEGVELALSYLEEYLR